MTSLASAYNHVGSSQPMHSHGGNADAGHFYQQMDAGHFYQQIGSTQVGGRRRKKTMKRRRKKSARRKSLRQYV